MSLEFLSNLGTTSAFLLLIVFIIFVFSVRKIFSVVMNVVWIALISLLFPIVMNRFFGYNLPTDANSLISFLLLGVGIYLIFIVGKFVYKTLGFAGKIVGKKKERKEKNPTQKPEKNTRESKHHKADANNDLAKRQHWIKVMEKNKRVGKYDEKDYVVLDDKEKTSRKNFAEPMKEIKYDKKDE